MALFKKGAVQESASTREKTMNKSKSYLDKALKLKPTYPTGNYYVGTIQEFIFHDKLTAKKHYKIACQNGMQAACGK